MISDLIKPQPNKNVAYKTRKQRLQLWVKNDLYARFQDRIIPIDLKIVNKWGEVQAHTENVEKPMPSNDGLISILGLVNDCIVVTRNIKDMENSTTGLLNPWDE